MSSNLVIIGNGFDLAHGLKTNYTSFINHIIECSIKERDSSNKKFKGILIISSPDITNKTVLYEKLRSGLFGLTKSNSASPIFLRLLSKFGLEQWCDVESEYYNLLLSVDTSDPSNIYRKDVAKLNSDFQRIKEELEAYLLTQQSSNAIDSYKRLLKYLCNSDSLLVNFNYTNTIKHLYADSVNHRKIIHIHGELKNDSNPMVFGYSAFDSECFKLIDKEENEYIKNIKRHQYKMADNEVRLKEFLNEKKDIEVSILGHSCGLSDKHILELMLNHKNVSSIRIYYYDNRESYFNLQTNIFRIIKNYDTYDRLVNFNDSTRMPQFDDGEEKSDVMKDFISKLIEERKRKRPPHISFGSAVS